MAFAKPEGDRAELAAIAFGVLFAHRGEVAHDNGRDSQIWHSVRDLVEVDVKPRPPQPRRAVEQADRVAILGFDYAKLAPKGTVLAASLNVIEPVGFVAHRRDHRARRSKPI